MEVGLVRKIDIDQEMQQAYLDYAMSVIVARALPDARDGLKPVHRRILYAMHDMGLRPNSSFKKSARVVGEVLGKYHPHSDTAVYDAMARMVQEFSMRYPLVDGQGNFGSVDGDPPAAMRYTEARIAEPSVDMLADIQKDTVNFVDNFDASLKEPTVLPAALPNLLINGASGIAVGMATNVPPHNLSEVIDALVYMLENWSKLDGISIDDLMGFIQGPDFPTGGVILGGLREDGLAHSYGTGRGRITVQARAHVEDMDRGRQRIIVTEIPYMTNKASLIERIANLAREGKLTGISDLRDESDRQGMRIVIELSKNTNSDKVLTDLYKRTAMQGTFSIIMLALVDGEPRLLSLKQALKVYIEHRLEIIRRRSEFELARAKARQHILEGYRIALKNLDEVINLIRKSPDAEAAQTRLMNKYKLSEIQAKAILDMPLRRLAALERKKIEDEYKQVTKQIKQLESLLQSPKKMRTAIIQELKTVKEAYGDRRRTQIVAMQAGDTAASMLTASDITPDKNVWVAINAKGLVSRSLSNKQPRPSGRDAPRWLLLTNTRNTLYLVNQDGKAAAIAVHSLPETDKLSDGIPFIQTSALRSKSELAAVFALPESNSRPKDWHVITLTSQGTIKKSPAQDLPGPIAQSFRVAKVKAGDSLQWVAVSDGSSELFIATSAGMAIRFSENEVRPMGLSATGVSGIKLKGDDHVIGFEVIDPSQEIFLLLSDGSAKRVKVTDFPIQGRYGQGVIAWKTDPGMQLVGIANQKGTTKSTIHLNRLAPKSIRLDDAPVRGRAAGGKQVVALSSDQKAVALTTPWQPPAIKAKKSKRKTSAAKKKKPPVAKKTAPKKKASPKSKAKKKSGPAKKTASKKKGGSSKKPKQGKLDL
ncbi:MAG: DNA gyrase subunit A [Anaerolineae bacterium]|nr:DNA gyrase subunit A [Anaerolineae bacterium]